MTHKLNVSKTLILAAVLAVSGIVSSEGMIESS